MTDTLLSAEARRFLGWEIYTYEIHFENGGSHLPAEEAGMPMMYTCLLVALVAFIPIYYRLVRNHQLVGGEAMGALSLSSLFKCKLSGVSSVRCNMDSLFYLGPLPPLLPRTSLFSVSPSIPVPVSNCHILPLIA